jgi:hypothetical protein
MRCAIYVVTATDYNRNKGAIFMVFEYMQHDLIGLIDNPEVSFVPSSPMHRKLVSSSKSFGQLASCQPASQRLLHFLDFL